MRAADGLRVVRPGAGANPLRAGRELLLTFAFRCNFACQFCYVEDGLGGRFRGVTLDEARHLLADPRLTDGVTRIVLSGGEVTLDRDLPRFAELARAVPSVEHVRIQTNASRLADPDLIARLRGAGVDEYFVSLHGADAATCDAITGVAGSFAMIEAGLAALATADATVVTNTVVCAANLPQLPAIVELAARHRARGAELWGYVPRVDAADDRRLLVRVTDAAPLVQRAVAAGLTRGLAMTVKYFPRCLLGDFADVHSDAQPRLVIDDAFWQDYPSYGCWYHGVCAAAQVADGCSGLSDAYVRRFGWEEHAVRPFVDDSGAAPTPPIAAYHDWSDRPAVVAPTAPRPIDLAALGLAIDTQLAGFRLRSATSIGDGARLAWVDADGAVAIDVHPLASGRDGFARTASLVLAHPVLPAARLVPVRPLLEQVAQAVRARDDGDLAARLFAPAPTPPKVPLVAAPPSVARFVRHAEQLIAAGLLAATELEPSVVVGAPTAVRWLVNPAVAGPGRDRGAIAADLLRALGAETLAIAASRWLAAPDRIAFVGGAGDGDAAPRAKLYLALASSADRAAAHALLGGPAPSATVTMLAADAIDDRIVAHKHYAPIEGAAARAAFDGGLIALVEARGLLLGELALLRADRFVDGVAIDAALHVDVSRFPQLELGPAWARASGDPDAAARIVASGRATRILSETAGTRDGRHVYLGGR